MSKDSRTKAQQTLSNDVGPLVLEILARMESVTTTTEIRAVRREFSKKLTSVSPRLMFELANQLIEQGSHACRFVAYELIAHHSASRSRLNAARLTILRRGIASWGTVDMFGIYLAGPAWQQNQISDSLIHRWTRSRDRWWRRAALVATVPLNSKTHGGTGDARRTLAICESLVSDRDDMVVKAMSWALRELAKRDPPAVKRFLTKQRKLIAPRVLREVNNKIETGLKNPRRLKQN